MRIAGPRARMWTATVACMVATAGGAAAAPPTTATPTRTFVATVEPIDDALAAEMSGVSWHPGCPVGLDELRLVRMPYWGFDGHVHDGELVLHRDVASDVAGVFGVMFTSRFPIARMERIEAFGGDDDASMAADNTSAFNCREITGGGSWSIHSYGKAIDINTVENPYVRGDTVLPEAGARYLDRRDIRPGMIVAGDRVVEAFAAIGFEWGGDWDRLQDYQHFEAADPSSAAQRGDASCTGYTDNADRYPIRRCHSGAAVRQVQRQLARRGFEITVDGRFGPATESAVRDFQSANGLAVDGLVGPQTWPALSAGAVTGTDADGSGAVDPWEIATPTFSPGCAGQPASEGWPGDIAALVDPTMARLEVTAFDTFLANAGDSVAVSPCDAARVLLHLDRPLDEGTIAIVVVEDDGTVTATLDQLADDSVRAVRYWFVFEPRGDGTIRLAHATWAQRCRAGRGHDEYSIEPCV